MSNHNQKVEPARFEPAAAQPDSPAAADTRAASPAPARHPWVVPALAVLALLTLLVFFWLPRQIDPGSVAVDAVDAVPVRPKAAASDVSPWSEAQLARQRKDAQAVLAELLDEQFALEEMQVQRWAAEAFAAAQALAGSGDEQYRQQQYLDAAASYQQALEAMLAIRVSAGQVFEEQFRSGLEALRSDQPRAAVAALELAVVLQPENSAALDALDRALNLEPLLALLLQANAARDAGELESARTLLQQARALDPEHAGAEAQLKTVERDIARRDFNRAMTLGYQALDDARYDEAERQFLKARGILPAAAETDSALQQARTARTRAQIDAFGRSAQSAEEREDWQQAINSYREILNIDDSVVFARAGLIRSQTRAGLDSSLRQALEQPLRLGDDAVYQRTLAMFQQAQGLEQKGPLLRKQLAELDELLKLAIKPVPVLLRSDEQTDVTVYKIAHLGTFSRQQLSLKPGSYTAVGVRKGYRDVRVEFVVDHSGDNGIVEISCTEPI